ncbi:DUF3597 domain-containing protein [Tianweitania populi]|uniref:DUF3597 domain-containing protein n=1 Tax=Tianweitania populi TaxID=1607949 RepID=A0A8J3DQG1_9HYPH|nr:DUF3597 domain-containing protein [Tianweitania populi]GHD14770.1 hypothetical protein GCM10016234_20720 [Tianweitania populi]
MSVFDKIKNAIWGTAHAAPAPKPAAAPAPAAPSAAPAAPGSAPTAGTGATATPTAGTAAPQSTPAAAPTAAPSAAPSAAPQAGGASQQAEVDVSAILEAAVAKKGEKLDWRHSIVDMMKALDLDSSLTNRKELAKELNYTGDTNDSATMNIWLHKALMKKLAANGGKVPAELTD